MESIVCRALEPAAVTHVHPLLPVTSVTANRVPRGNLTRITNKRFNPTGSSEEIVGHDVLGQPRLVIQKPVFLVVQRLQSLGQISRGRDGGDRVYGSVGVPRVVLQKV